MSDKANKKTKRKALGRGLNALISSQQLAVSTNPEVPSSEIPELTTIEGGKYPQGHSDENHSKFSGSAVHWINISHVINSLKQPRKEFDEQELKELAASIKEFGVLQPILVRPLAEEKFEIVAGERRWRASKLAGLEQVPALIHDFDNRTTLEVALVENVQRSNLNAVEEACAYKALIEEFSLSQAQVAQRVGKERATIANYLRLLQLPEKVLNMVRDGILSVGHAKAILTVKEPAAQRNLARKCVEENLSVRALEAIVARRVKLSDPKRQKRSPNRTGSYPEIVDKLRNLLGTKVVIRHNSSGNGTIEIQYYSEEELGRLVDKLDQ